jgi:hypothetical protein
MGCNASSAHVRERADIMGYILFSLVSDIWGWYLPQVGGYTCPPLLLWEAIFLTIVSFRGSNTSSLSISCLRFMEMAKRKWDSHSSGPALKMFPKNKAPFIRLLITCTAENKNLLRHRWTAEALRCQAIPYHKLMQLIQQQRQSLRCATLSNSHRTHYRFARITQRSQAGRIGISIDD